MACMKEKIKNLFTFMGRAWGAGFHGKMGVIMVIIAVFWSIGIFTGKTTLQGFIINIWRLNTAQEQLVAEQAKLEQLQKHIDLVQKNSPDYIEELGLKRLNMGDAKTKILKI
jgi:cellobiose-specific phosphotransferase system component IIC